MNNAKIIRIAIGPTKYIDLLTQLKLENNTYVFKYDASSAKAQGFVRRNPDWFNPSTLSWEHED